jgi:hypothetical protein
MEIQLNLKLPEYGSQEILHPGLIGTKRLKTVMKSLNFLFIHKSKIKKSVIRIAPCQKNTLRVENLEQARILVRELISHNYFKKEKIFIVNDIRSFVLPQEKILNTLNNLLILGSFSKAKKDLTPIIKSVLSENRLDFNITMNLLKISTILEMLFECAIKLDHSVLIYMSDKTSLEHKFNDYYNQNKNLTLIEVRVK